ncbi:hypothetical protein AKJ48_00400 [candidate division MSBL1 archaeon SCGC-AAA261O19]|uniref:Proteasome assembly chaperone family protein n=1 Tax=candidate division MSBL1 archaeon SCGC-AAA261O19 TaxID=1698277 RepID=A0A133VF57_9EURY|nr:hypothetical protein AKJ48_00400 [candidate division MSBL1 archaeon SCGC-AAA261O19]
MATELNYLKEPKLENPVTVAGLPGIANIGKLAVEYLINELESEKFAELYTDYFPGWVVRDSGLIEGLRVNFYEGGLEGSDRDFILVTADAQASSSTGQYKLSRKVLDVIADQAADMMVTMAAFLAPREDKSLVVGAATDAETAKLIEDHGVELLEGGRIVGMNGLLVSLAYEKGIEGCCLLGTTLGGVMDEDASKNVLSSLSDVLEFDLDLANFKDQVPDLPKLKPPKMKMPSVTGTGEDISYIR